LIEAALMIAGMLPLAQSCSRAYSHSPGSSAHRPASFDIPAATLPRRASAAGDSPGFSSSRNGSPPRYLPPIMIE